MASKKRDGLDSEYTNSTVNQTCQVLSTLICAWFPDGERPVETGDKVTIELTPEIGTRNLRFDSVGRRDSEVAFIPFEQRACLPKATARWRFPPTCARRWRSMPRNRHNSRLRTVRFLSPQKHIQRLREQQLS